METIISSRFVQEVANRIFIYRERISGFRAPHRHDFVEIGLVLQGSGTHLTATGEYPLTPGDVFVIVPTAWHGVANAEGLRIHYCCFSPGILQRELHTLMTDAMIHHLLVSGPRQKLGVENIHLSEEALAYCLRQTDDIWNLASAMESDGNACVLTREKPMRSYAKQTAHLILLLSCLGEQLVVRQEEVGRGGCDSALNAVVEQIQAYPERDWTLLDMAKVVCLEPSYFVRRFRKEFCVSPMRFLYHTRMQRASELLLGTDQAIQEVADRCGYTETSHFTARFRQYFGVTPSMYRHKVLVRA